MLTGSISFSRLKLIHVSIKSGVKTPPSVRYSWSASRRSITADLIETWLDYKRSDEIDPIRLRPHPHEFELYFDI